MCLSLASIVPVPERPATIVSQGPVPMLSHCTLDLPTSFRCYAAPVWSPLVSLGRLAYAPSLTWSAQKPARWACERDEVALAPWRIHTWSALSKSPT